MAKTASRSKPRKSSSPRRSSTKRASASSKRASANSNASSSAQSYARKATSAAQNASADALKNWTNMFQQSPFKMEGFDPKSFGMPSMPSMPNLPSMPSFPQFDQFQSKSKDTADQVNTFVNKATSAAEKSRNRLAAGAEECSKTLASMAQSNMQRANEALRSLMACKSLNEYADVQNRLFKQNFEAMSSETAKLVEQVTKTVTSASEPLNDLASAAMTEAKKSMAA